MPRILMCPPDHFGIEYEINPWMDRSRGADRALAARQWQGLVELLRGLGAELEFLAPQPGLPDLVFTANAGVVQDRTFIPSRFRHPQRQGEQPWFEAWFADHGYDVQRLGGGGHFEGAGDALYCGDTLFAGYLRRSDIQAHHEVAQRFACEVLSLELVDPRFYHLDTCFCPLAPGVALHYPGAFDEYGRQVIQSRVATAIAVPEPVAVEFGCNAVVVGRDVVHHAGTDGGAALRDLLAPLGFRTHPTALGEFLKAGGAAKCLTLRLDGEDAADWPLVSRSASSAPASPAR